MPPSHDHAATSTEAPIEPVEPDIQAVVQARASHVGEPAPTLATWHPSPEAVGGAIFASVTLGYVLGPVGALIGMPLGGFIASAITRRLASRQH